MTNEIEILIKAKVEELIKLLEDNEVRFDYLRKSGDSYTNRIELVINLKREEAIERTARYSGDKIIADSPYKI